MALSIVFFLLNIALWIFFFILFKTKFSPSRILHNIRDEVDKLIIEINRAADSNITIIDERTKRLKALIDEASKRTLLSDKEAEKREREQSVLAALRAPPRTEGIGAAASRAANAYRQVQAIQTPPLSAPQTSTLPDIDTLLPPPPTESETAATPDVPAVPPPDMPVIVRAQTQIQMPAKNLRTQVLELSGVGLLAEDIAEHLGVSVTEVQLMIDLYG
jgi:hypothetical protein